MRPLLLLLAFACGISVSNAQTLTTNPVAGSLCAGASFNLSFNASGFVPNSNMFQAQLSDPLGSFANPTAIGSVVSNTSGIIPVQIPTTAAGARYRIRVVSTNPVVIGGDNGADILITVLPLAGTGSKLSGCAGSLFGGVIFSSNFGNATYSWVNNNPAIGLPVSGSGNVPAFTAVNTSNSAKTAVLSVTPTANGCAGRTELVTIAIAPAAGVSAVNQTACLGAPMPAQSLTSPVNGAIVTWTNNNPAIGLAASGTGGLPTFPTTGSPTSVTSATISITANVPMLYCKIYRTHSGNGSIAQYPANPADGSQFSAMLNSNNSNTHVESGGLALPVSVLNWSSSAALSGAGVGSVPSDYFAVEITGTFIPKETGVYTFQIDGDDAVDISLNGAIVTGRYGAHGFGLPQVGTITLSAGVSYDLRVRQQDYAGGEGLTLSWKRPSQAVFSIQSDEIGGCTESKSVTYTVVPRPAIAPIPDIYLCNGAPYFYNASASTPADFSWQSSHGYLGVAPITAGSSISLAPVNTGSVPLQATLTLTASFPGFSQCASALTVPVTIEAPIKAAPVASKTVCVGTAISQVVPAGGPSGTIYQWTNSNTSIGLPASGTGIIPSFAATNTSSTPQTGQITVTPNRPILNYTLLRTHAGNGSTTQYPANPTSTAQLNSLFSLLNSNTTVLGTGQSIPATLFNWTATSTLTGSGIAAPADYFALEIRGTFVPKESGAYTFQIDGDDAVDLSINGSVIAGYYGVHGMGSPVTGTVSLVSGTAYTLLVRQQEFIGGEGLSLKWKRPSQATYTLQPDEIAGCAGIPATFTYTVNPTPSALSVSTQALCPAVNAAITFSSPVAGTTFNWTNSNPAIGLAANGSGDISFVPNGLTTQQSSLVTVTASATNDGVTCTKQQTLNLIVNPLPSMTTPLNKVVCSSGPLSASLSGSPAGTVFNWTNSNTAIGLAASGSGDISITAANSGNSVATASIQVTPRYTANSLTCSGSPVTFNWSVNPIPVLTINPANLSLCHGSTSPITFTSSVAGSDITWTNNNTATGIAASGIGSLGNVTANNSGTTSLVSNLAVNVTYSNGGVTCAGAANAATISIHPIPDISVPSSQSLCRNGLTSLAGFTSTVANSSFNWTNSNAAIGLATSGSGALPGFVTTNNTTAPVTGIIAATAVANGCTSASKSFLVTVLPAITVNDIPAQTLCPGTSSAAIALSSPFGGVCYVWANNDASVGLAASGSGNIPSFMPVNTGTDVKQPQVGITPILKVLDYVVYSTHNGTGSTSQYVSTPTNTAGMDQLFDLANTHTRIIEQGRNAAGVLLAYTSAGQLDGNGTPMAVADYYGLKVTGSFVAVETGIYTFQIDGDDAVDLFIDGNLVVGYYGTHGTGAPVTGTVSLVAGTTYTLRIRQQEFSGGEGLSLKWKRPSQSSFSLQGDELADGCSGTSYFYTYKILPIVSATPVATQLQCAGSAIPSLSFTSATTGTLYNWTNTNSSIGLAASGTGALPAYTALNATASAAIAQVTVQPYLAYNGISSTVDYNFNGSPQTFVVPAGVVALDLEAWGAEGASGSSVFVSSGFGGTTYSGGAGGKGAYVKGTLAVTPGQVLTIYVGGSGVNAGYNGGGTNGGSNGGTGGGGTDIRMGGTGVNNRVVVAGGGGGGGSAGSGGFTGGAGGTGGGGFGSAGGGSNPGQGGGSGSSHLLGGAAGRSISCSSAGSGTGGNFGQGGMGNSGGGGGGGGYLGGGGGGGGTASSCFLGSALGVSADGGGAGGNNFLGTLTNTTSTSGVRSGNGLLRITYAVQHVCSGNAQTFAIKVNPTPAPLSPVSNQLVCGSASTSEVTFSNTLAGTEYSWTNSTPAIGLPASGMGTIPSFTATNSGTTALTGTIAVTPQYTTDGRTCSGAGTSFGITINPKPVLTLASSASFCSGTNGSLAINSNVPGSNITWSNDNPATGLAASGTGTIPNFATTNNGSTPIISNITVNASSTMGGLTCNADTKTSAITVSPTPSITLPEGQALCKGQSVTGLTFSSTVPAALFYWTNSNIAIGLASSGGGQLPSFTAANAGSTPIYGTITVAANAYGCNSVSKTFVLTVLPPLSATRPANTTTCPGSTTVPINLVPATPGTSIRWTNSDPSIGLAASGKGNIPSFTPANDDPVNRLATISVIPVSKALNYAVYRTHAGNGSTNQYPGNPNNTSEMDALFNTANSNTTLVTKSQSTPSALLDWSATTQLTNNAVPLPSTDQFALRISGTFTAAESGAYTFQIDGDDAVDISLDGNIVASRYGTHGMGAPVTGSITLVAGSTYNLVVRQQDFVGGEGLSLKWKRPSQSAFALQGDEFADGCDGTPTTFTLTVLPRPRVSQLPTLQACNAVTFAGQAFSSAVAGQSYSWTNNNTAIGLAASGIISVPSFLAVNTSGSVQTAQLQVIPALSYLGDQQVQDFAFSGGQETWTVPNNVTSVVIEAWGAKGGAGYSLVGTPGAGGSGAYVKGTLAVQPGQVLNLFIGGAGGTPAGGYNGGGTGGGNSYPGGGGGGATDVRVGGVAPANRVLSAAGGGGGGAVGESVNSNGGSGGSASGSGGFSASGGGGSLISAGGGGGGTCARGTGGSNGSSQGTGGAGGAGSGNKGGSGGGGGGGYAGAGGGGGGGNSSCIFGAAAGTWGGGGGGGGGQSYAGGLTNTTLINSANASNGRLRITYLPRLTCVGDPMTTTIAVNPTPSASISYPAATYCNASGGSALATRTGTAGGTFSSTSGLAIDAATGTIDIANSAAGVYTVTYRISGIGCNPYSATTQVTISEPSTVAISYTGGPYCNSGSVTPQQSGATGGVYSASPAGLAIDAATGTIDLSASQQGAYTVTYNVTSSACSLTASTSVEVFASVSTTIAYPGSPFCASSGIVPVFISGLSGGSYTASPAGLSLNTLTGAIDLGASAPGIYTVTYTANNGACAILASAPVTVRPPALVTVLDNRTFCGGTLTTPINFDAPAGTTFSWINDNPAIGLQPSGTGPIPAFNAINNSAVNVYANVSVYPTGGTDCSLKPYVVRITVKPQPSVNAVAGQVLCAGTSSAPIAFSGNATTAFTWTNNNPSIGLGAAGTGAIAAFNAVNNSGVPQTATVTVVPVAAGCTGASTSFTIAVSPAAGSISYPQATYCQYAWAYVRRTGAAGGTYTATPAGLALNAVDGSINLGASPPGTYTITYSVGALAGCGATASTQLTVQPQASVNPIANQLYCSGMITAPIPFTGSASNFSWTNDNPSIGLAASGSGLALPSFTAVNAGPTLQTAYIRVTPLGNGSSNCPGKPMTFRITVNYCLPVTSSTPPQGDAATLRTALSRQFVVGPNPATSTVVLQYSGTHEGAFAVRVVTQSGEALTKPRTFSGSTCSLSLDGIAPGSYLLEVTQLRTGITFKRQLIKL